MPAQGEVSRKAELLTDKEKPADSRHAGFTENLIYFLMGLRITRRPIFLHLHKLLNGALKNVKCTHIRQSLYILNRVMAVYSRPVDIHYILA